MLAAIGWGVFRFLQVCAFVATIISTVFMLLMFLNKQRFINEPSQSPPGIYIGAELRLTETAAKSFETIRDYTDNRIVRKVTSIKTKETSQ